jgi:lambda family phage tail tape measure protein
VRAMADASLSAQKGLLDMLPKTAGTIDLGVSLENKKLELQKEQITETQRLIKELELSRLSAEKLAIETRRDESVAKSTEPSVRAALTSAAEPRLKEIQDREKVLNSTNISADTRSGKLARTPETLAAMQQQQGAFARIAAITSQQEQNIVKAEVDKVTALYVDIKRGLDNELKTAVQERDTYMRGEGFRSDTLEQQQKTLAGFTANEAAINRQVSLLEDQRNVSTFIRIETLALKNGWYSVATEAGLAAQKAQEQSDFTKQSVDETNRLNKGQSDIKNKLDLQLEAMKLQNIEVERNITLAKITSDSEIALLGIRKQELQLQYDKGLITLDIYNQEVYAIETVDRAKQKEAKTAALVAKYTVDALAYAKELASATVAQLPEIRARFAALQDVYDAELDGVAKVFTANEKLADQQRALPERQQAYADLFTQAFKSMEDAIVSFTKTGKLNFSSMIESFIEGLLRFEIQQQQMALFRSVGGASGLAGSLINAGFTLFDTNTAGNSMYDAGLNQMAPSAKGNAFDYGIQAFAKGGAFTNSIVDSPTMFRFAKGTGLMGEAGPEAIMPLARDGSGNLGVRANGGGANVDVVVNNYGNEKATTKETVDSRGNRRIEVTVGDMVAQEVTRTGSAAQTAFSSTYGTRPALARR